MRSTAARALSMARRAPAFLPPFLLPVTTVIPSRQGPSVRWDALPRHQRPS
jgi:hypothetical protein